MKYRILALFVLVLVLSGVILSRAAYLQIIHDPRLAHLAKRQFQSKIMVQARRGLILDRNREPLAINTEISSLAANPKKLQNPRTLIRLLSKALEIPPQKLQEQFRSKKDFVWIKRHLKDHSMDALKKWAVLDPQGNLPTGLWIVQENDRKYPHGELAAPLLGSVDLDNQGVEGIELWQNLRLAGKGTKASATRDALGRPTSIDPSLFDGAQDGENIELTLDASLQFAVEESLRRSIESTKARSGMVIVMDASNGDILTLANYPTFNPNLRIAPPEFRKNRALTDLYEPGSTIKPIHLAGALRNGKKITDKIHGEHGKMRIQGRTISESEAHEKFEWISLQKMIQVSSNVVSAKLALNLGNERILHNLRLFGLGGKTGIGLGGESSGSIPAPKKYFSPLSLANIGFGHGVMVTPIQIIRAYAAFANGGYLVEPRILKDSAAHEGVRILDPEVVADVQMALESVVQPEGTGRKAFLPGYRIAGKTGTAQTVDPVTKRYSSTRYISTFVGYPIGVFPKITILTYLDDPRPVYYSSETAAPLFRDVLYSVVNRYGIPTQGDVTKITQSSAVAARKSAPASASLEKSASPLDRVAVIGTNPQGARQYQMPSLRGLSLMEALELLKEADPQVESRGSGWIKEQFPAPGTTLVEHSKIRLQLVEEED